MEARSQPIVRILRCAVQRVMGSLTLAEKSRTGRANLDRFDGPKFPAPAEGDRLRVAVVYPGPFSEGLASLAVHGLLRLFNGLSASSAEPVFFDRGPSPRGAVTGRALADFDLLACSISFEQQWAALPVLLDRAGIPGRFVARDDRSPLVLAGGVACRLNPRPGLPYIDLLVPGDAEAVAGELVSTIEAGRGRPRQALLDALDALPGIIAQPFAGKTVRALFHDAGPPVCQLGRGAASAFAGVFLVETGRGCPAGCRFCALGFGRRPPLFYGAHEIRAHSSPGLERGERIGLVGASLGRHPSLALLVEQFSDAGADVSPASLDPEVLSSEAGRPLLASLTRGGQRTVTLAPEAGSERLRRAINKPFSDEALEEAVARLGEAGVVNLKLYLMYGLPFEAADDRKAIIGLIDRIRKRWLRAHRSRGGTGRLGVSLNPFVPKPHTPFELEPLPSIPDLKRMRDGLFRGLRRLGGVDVGGFSPRQAAWQCLLDRADESVADLLDACAGTWPPKGGRWRSLWPEGLERAHREWPESEIPPWHMVDVGLDRAFLRRERQRASVAKTTPPCSPKRCGSCGACLGMREP